MWTEGSRAWRRYACCWRTRCACVPTSGAFSPKSLDVGSCAHTRPFSKAQREFCRADRCRRGLRNAEGAFGKCLRAIGVNRNLAGRMETAPARSLAVRPVSILLKFAHLPCSDAVPNRPACRRRGPCSIWRADRRQSCRCAKRNVFTAALVPFDTTGRLGTRRLMWKDGSILGMCGQRRPVKGVHGKSTGGFAAVAVRVAASMGVTWAVFVLKL